MSILILLSVLNLIAAEPPEINAQSDTVKNNQLLYNGRVWRDLYHRVDGDQFFMAQDFFPGTVSMEGRLYHNVPLRYDILKDELNARSPGGLILQVNKELIDSFSIRMPFQTYRFEKFDSLGDFGGYMNILYKGEVSLYVKYRKQIELLAVDRKIDRFYETKKMFLVMDGVPHRFFGKSELMRLFGEDGKKVREHVRENKLLVRRGDPQSFVRPVHYFNSLKQ